MIQAWSPESPPDGIFRNTPEMPTTWGSGSSAAAVALSPTTLGPSQRSWLRKGAFYPQRPKNMAAGGVVWTCTPNPGLEPGEKVRPQVLKLQPMGHMRPTEDIYPSHHVFLPIICLSSRATMHMCELCATLQLPSFYLSTSLSLG